MDERRDMGELDRDPSAQRSLPRRRGQVHEQRAQALPSGGDGVPADRGDEARVALDRELEPLLELVEERPRFGENGLRAHGLGFTAVCSATLPPPSRR